MIKKRHLTLIVGLIISAATAYQQGNETSNSPTQSQPMVQASKNPQQSQHMKNSPSSRKTERNYNNNYNNALRLMWSKVYKNSGKTLYCDKPFSTKSRKERMKSDTNAEHIFPMSWVTKELNCGSRKECQDNSAKFRKIESDLHNIYPADRIVNKMRSNYRFGEVAGEERQFGQCDFEVDSRKRVAEPTPKKRGEVARAILYIAHQYQLSLHGKTRQLMQKWDKEDPPSKEEKRRQAIIHREQGRENKFITQYPFTGK